MKSLAVLALLCLTLACYGGVTSLMQMVVARKNVAGGWTQEISATGGTDKVCGNPSTTHLAFEFVPDNAGDLESVTFYARTVGTPGANTFDVEIWTDSAGKPSAVISGATVQFNQSELSASHTEKTVTLGTPAAISTGTVYYVVFHADQQDSFDYIWIDENAAGGSGWDIHGSSDGTNWGDVSFDAFLRGSISGT